MNLLSDKKRLLKWAGMLVLIVAAAILNVFVTLNGLFPAGRIKEAMEAELSNTLNQKVTITDASLAFYHGLELAMSGVRVSDPQTSQEIVSAARVGLTLNLLKLLERKVVFEGIEVASPHLELMRAGGKWNVETMVEAVKLKRQPSERKPAEKVGRLEIEPIKVRNGTVRVHDILGRTLSVQKITATIDLKNEDIRIDSASVSFPPITADVAGKVSQLSAAAPVVNIDAAVHVSKEGPFAEAQSINLPAGATMADASVTARGTIEEIALDSTFSVNSSATKGIPTEGTFTGVLKTNEGYLNVSALNSSFGKSSISLSGSCSNLWADDFAANLEGTSKVALEEVLNLTGGKLVSKIQPQGLTDATVALSASTKQIGLKANLDLTNAGLVIPDLTRKEPGTPGSLVIDARYVMPKEIVVDNFELNIGEGKVSGQVSVNPEKKPWMQAALNMSDFPLENLNAIPSMNFQKGALALTARVWQSKPARLVNTNGTARIHNAVLTSDYLKQPVTDLDIVADWSGEKVNIESASFSFVESACQVSAIITDFAQPQIVGSFHADTLHLDDMIAAIGRETPEETSEAISRSQGFSLRMLVAADSLRVGDIKTGTLSGTLQGTGESYTFAPFQLNVFNGVVNGTYEVTPSEAGVRWKVKFDGERMDLKEIDAQLGKGEINVTGLLEAKGELQGDAASTTVDVLKSLDGQFKVTAKDGVIERYTLLKTIFTLMQVPVGTLLVPGLREITIFNTLLDAVRTSGRSFNLTSFAYTKIKGSFRTSKGVAHSDDLRYESGIADLLFTGDINLPQSTMDMKVRATPLGAIGSLIGNVPLAGKEVKKAKETVISTDFIARGPISNPTVTPATVEKLKKAIDDI